MKKIIALLIISIVVYSCAEDQDDNLSQNVQVGFNFSHHWDGITVTNADFNQTQYTNANGDEMDIEKLRYLISNITFTNSSGEQIVVDDYNLVDVTNNTDLNYNPGIVLPRGIYSVSFTFGFDNEDNYQNYPDLNTALWNVPEMMGGGYHFMQLEGKFLDNNIQETAYAYHTIRAVDMSNVPDLTFEDTFFEVNLGQIDLTSNTSVEVKMNIAEWFKNPNQWDLNVLNNSLMQNYDAQIMMYENGQTVFSLGDVTH